MSDNDSKVPLPDLERGDIPAEEAGTLAPGADAGNVTRGAADRTVDGA